MHRTSIPSSLDQSIGHVHGVAVRDPRVVGPRPRIAIPLAAGMVVGLAVWVTGGSLAAADAGASAARVGLLPHWWLAAGVAVLVGVVGIFAPGRWLVPTFLLAVLLVPWLPVPVPDAFLLWGGPLRWWIWAGAITSTIVAAWPRAGLGVRGAAMLCGPRSGAVAALVLGAAAFSAGALQVSDVFPGGDEPHYLVIVQSLLRDGDLQIENNHRRGDYHAYYGGRIEPHYLRPGRYGQIYSVHAPGIPVVVAPAFAVGGYPAVVILLVILSALGTMLVWRTAWLLTGSAGAAWFGWASVALTAPFFYHSFAVFPDALGAGLIASGVLALVCLELEEKLSVRRWALHGAALALLPWLHTRFAVAAAVLGACIALRLLVTGIPVAGARLRHPEATAGQAEARAHWSRRAHWPALFAFMAVPVVSAAGWFAFFYVIYGTINPAAPYGSYTQTQLSNIVRGLPGLLLDQQFGVIPNAPVYLCAMLGLALLFRRRPRLTMEISAVVFVYLAAVSTYHMWWGGWSAPARFAVPVLLTLGIPAAVFWAGVRRAGRATAGVALGVSVLVTGTLALVQGGRLIFNSRDGFGRWLDFVSPIVDLPRALPSFFRDGPRTMFLESAVWLLALSAAAAFVWLLARRSRAEADNAGVSLALGAQLVFVAAGTLAVTLNWQLVRTQPVAPGAAQLQLLHAASAGRLPLSLSYSPLALLSTTDAVRELRLGQPHGRPSPPPRTRLALGHLPAGSYRLDPASVAAARGTVIVRVWRGTHSVVTWTFDPSQGQQPLSMELPVPMSALIVEGDERACATIPALTLQPVSVVPASARVFDQPARRAVAYPNVKVYSFDDRAFLEQPGFWTSGGITVPVVLAVEDIEQLHEGTLRLLVRNGANDNKVELRSGPWSARLELAPREEQVVELPVGREAKAALLQVHSERGFRPSKADPGSRDERYLGVWIEPLKPTQK